MKQKLQLLAQAIYDESISINLQTRRGLPIKSNLLKIKETIRQIEKTLERPTKEIGDKRAAELEP